MTLAQKIKTKREAAGMSREELAERVGCCVGTIYQWEEGRRKPRHRHFVKIIDALDIGMIEFFREVDE